MCVLKVGHGIGACQILCRNGLCDQTKFEVRQGDGQSHQPRRTELPPHDALPFSL